MNTKIGSCRSEYILRKTKTTKTKSKIENRNQYLLIKDTESVMKIFQQRKVFNLMDTWVHSDKYSQSANTNTSETVAKKLKRRENLVTDTISHQYSYIKVRQ
jgi:hypothetical protein